MTPADVADLTDDQLERLYRRPAIERAERVEREGKGEAPPVASLDASRPGREAFVASMLNEFGGDRAKWDEAYDRLKGSWDAAE